MNEQIKIGTRVLFTTGPGTPIQSGTVEEYAPSGKYIGLSVDTLEAWYPLSLFSVVEKLNDPVAAPPLKLVPPVLTEAGGNTGGSPGPDTNPGTPTS